MQFACKSSSCACGKCMLMLSAEKFVVFLCIMRTTTSGLRNNCKRHLNNSRKLCKLTKSAASHARHYIKNVDEKAFGGILRWDFHQTWKNRFKASPHVLVQVQIQFQQQTSCLCERDSALEAHFRPSCN